MKNNITVGYWNFTYKAQPVRYVFELASYPYTNKIYDFNNKTEWETVKQKNTLGFNYPNLPYIIDGDVKITESQNIIIYAVDVTNQQQLRGTGSNKYKIDNIRFLCDDLGRDTIETAFFLKGDEQRKSYDTKVIPKFKQLANDLGNKIYFFENRLTLADLYAYTTVQLLRKTNETEYKQFSKSFDAFLKNFESIPAIKKHHESATYKSLAA